MCATTDHPAEDSTRGETTPSSTLVNPLSSQFSSQTRLSIKQQNDDVPAAAAEGSANQQDSTTSSSRARIRSHNRYPSLVQSDDGLGHGNGDDCSHVSSETEPVGSFCAQIVLPAVCQGAGDQLDIFMACRHPLDLLGISGNPHDDDEQNHGVNGDGDHTVAADHQVSGYHAIPTTCEYCGSNDIGNCPDECQRPKSFFPKQRPPFCSKGGLEWDEMDFAVSTLAADNDGGGVVSSNRIPAVRS
jgi:hypothetical protein